MTLADFLAALLAGAIAVAVFNYVTRRIVLRHRFTGRTYNPARPVIRRAGAERVGANGTGRICSTCGAYTWGLSDACGRCGRRSVAS